VNQSSIISPTRIATRPVVIPVEKDHNDDGGGRASWGEESSVDDNLRIHSYQGCWEWFFVTENLIRVLSDLKSPRNSCGSPCGCPVAVSNLSFQLLPNNASADRYACPMAAAIRCPHVPN
jgi:hypothetical protein